MTPLDTVLAISFIICLLSSIVESVKCMDESGLPVDKPTVWSHSNGFMFDVVALSDITITTMTFNTAGCSGNHSPYVFTLYKRKQNGSWSEDGIASDSSAWEIACSSQLSCLSLLDTDNGDAQLGTEFYGTCCEFHVPIGWMQALYLYNPPPYYQTSVGTGYPGISYLNYRHTTEPGRWICAQDDNLAVYTGYGINGLFGTLGNASRKPAVKIYYSKTPTSSPTPAPTGNPVASPTNNPTPSPTMPPTSSPTNNPTPAPTSNPTPAPTNNPIPSPTMPPTSSSTNNPTLPPTNNPSPSPTMRPTSNPTNDPTDAPTIDPTKEPTPAPTSEPTGGPTSDPTNAPTPSPTSEATDGPTSDPTNEPTPAPTSGPTPGPTADPTVNPTSAPTNSPTLNPTNPSIDPTVYPTLSPTFTRNPTDYPTSFPTKTYSTMDPTERPSDYPTSYPTKTYSTTSTTNNVYCNNVDIMITNLVGITSEDFIKNDDLRLFITNCTRYGILNVVGEYGINQDSFWVSFTGVFGDIDVTENICSFTDKSLQVLYDIILDENTEISSYIGNKLSIYFANKYGVSTDDMSVSFSLQQITSTISNLDPDKNNNTFINSTIKTIIIIVVILLIFICIIGLFVFYCKKLRENNYNEKVLDQENEDDNTDYNYMEMNDDDKL